MNDFFIADDLSGALDVAAAFHRAGRDVRIALTADASDTIGPGTVAGITTETRNASPAAAAAAVRRAIERGSAQGDRLRYKKIDSTLRGPVAAELTALLQALPKARVLFAPANPRVGRTVRDGVLLVHGVPVAESDFGRDPACPLRHSSIREILGDAVSDRVVIPDTASEADLVAAVRQMTEHGGEWVAVGSGALAIPVAYRCSVADRSQGDAPAPAVDGGCDPGRENGRPARNRPSRGALEARPAGRVAHSPVLMIGGSAHPLNRRQAEELRRTHDVAIHEVALADSAVAADLAVATLRTTGTAILQLPAERTNPRAALAGIVAAATQAIDAATVRRVFATGGETAFALSERLGLTMLHFIDEIEPGLSLSIGQARGGSMLLAVKPGGFGDDRTWVRAWERLFRNPSERESERGVGPVAQG